ncbi:MAG: hypothetical protein HQL19_02540, partial [Candidatus Omnitrophica bacterium]|nr:hypothetical protein [Candidatus Omnitrophota bacterium]
ENSFLYPGLFITEKYQRRYPHNDIGAHLLGYVGKADPARREISGEYGYVVPEMMGYSGIQVEKNNKQQEKVRIAPAAEEIKKTEFQQKKKIAEDRNEDGLSHRFIRIIL